MASKAKDTNFITIRGSTSYAKILGQPVDNYDGNGKEWKLDLIIDDEVDLPRLKKLGIGDRVKQKENYLDGRPHISLRQKANRADGTPNDPPVVVDVTGAPWDGTKLIGNDTKVDVRLRVVDYGRGLKQGIYIAGIRVLKLVPYSRPVFDDIDENDEYYQEAIKGSRAEDFDAAPPKETKKPAQQRRAPVDDDLDDDVPF